MANTNDAYDRITFHGKPLDRATVTALQEAEERLGYELTVVQGIGGATASAGTHTEGRAVDLAPWDQERKVRVLKQLGFAAWYRPPLPGVWGAHIHAVLILNTFDNARGIAPAAFRQIDSYRRVRDGLKYDQPDPTPWRPDPIPVFVYPPKEKPVRPKRNKVTRARDRLAEAHAALEQALALVRDTDEQREAVHAQRDELRTLIDGVEVVLERLPER